MNILKTKNNQENSGSIREGKFLKNDLCIIEEVKSFKNLLIIGLMALAVFSIFITGCQRKRDNKTAQSGQIPEINNSGSMNYDEMRGRLEQILKSNPSHLQAADAQSTLGQLILQKTKEDRGFGYEIYDTAFEESIGHFREASRLLDMEPGNGIGKRAIRLEIATSFYNCGYIDEAFNEAKKLVESSPATPEGLDAGILLIQFHLVKGNISGILPEIQRMERLVEKNNNAPVEVIFQLAYTYYMLDNYDKAAEYFKKIILKYPENYNSYEARIYLAAILLKKGDKKQALALLDKVTDKINRETSLINKNANTDTEDEVLFGMVVDVVARADYDGSIVKYDNDNIESKKVMAKTLFKEKKYSDALEQINDLEKSLANISNTGKTSVEGNFKNPLVKSANKGIYVENLLRTGTILLCKNRKDDAKEVLTNLMKIAPDTSESVKAMIMLAGAGTGDEKLLKEASSVLNKVPDTDTAKNRFMLANAFYDNSQYNEAEAECRRTINKYPSYLESKLAALLTAKMKVSENAPEAARLILNETEQSAFPSENDSPEFLIEAGDIHNALGETAASVELYRRAFSNPANNDNSTDAAVKLGNVLFLQGETDPAREALLNVCNELISWQKREALMLTPEFMKYLKESLRLARLLEDKSQGSRKKKEIEKKKLDELNQYLVKGNYLDYIKGLDELLKEPNM
ncbi:MAG: tetratricopeptide repeat protein [Chloroflexi bacterium]|nr:tetratricopeptide repeat protein [Chloroflexota bacterium]